MLKISNLVKYYGDRVALKDISFEVNAGEVVGFLGPNGAGKTTTMKIIAGALAPSSGQVTVCGQDVFETPIAVKKRIGYLPEKPPVYGDMRVLDYLNFVADLRGVARNTVGDSMEKTQIVDVSHRLIQHLSKGYQQRVGLAQALLGNPRLLILDEPTVGLDPKQIVEMRSLIMGLENQTILLSSHILSEVQSVCDKAIIINQGEVILQDTIQNLELKRGGGVVRLKTNPLNQKVQEQFKALDIVQDAFLHNSELELHLSEISDTVMSEISQFAFKQGYQLIEQRRDEKKLEDIFVELVS